MTPLRTLPVARDPAGLAFTDGDAVLPPQRRRLDGDYHQLKTEFDPALGAVWMYMRPEGVPCFNLDLLAELLRFNQRLAASQGRAYLDEALVGVRYCVCASRMPGVFNYGGDLALFAQLAETRDRQRLLHYAALCVQNLYRQTRGFHPPIITLALIQGAALGGGFEAALSYPIIIAERSSTFGFPEILFNLFPGMGASSFLTRRIGLHRAEDFIASGATYRAVELAAMGIVDAVEGKTRNGI